MLTSHWPDLVTWPHHAAGELGSDAAGDGWPAPVVSSLPTATAVAPAWAALHHARGHSLRTPKAKVTRTSPHRWAALSQTAAPQSSLLSFLAAPPCPQPLCGCLSRLSSKCFSFSQRALAPPFPLCRLHCSYSAKCIFMLTLLVTGGLQHASFLKRPLYTVLFSWLLNIAQRHHIMDSNLLLRVRGVSSKSDS